jgi:cell division protein FtsA
VARKARYVVGLDVGTSKVSAIIGEADGAGEVHIVGIGTAESRGIRRGVVVNLEAAVNTIKTAVEEAELTSGVEVDTVHLGLAGAHVKGFNSRGVVAVVGKNREITRDDVRRAIDAARAVSLPGDREILHVLPQDFVVDEEDGIGAPVGMTGSRLASWHLGDRHNSRTARGQRGGPYAGRKGARRRAARHWGRYDGSRHL